MVLQKFQQVDDLALDKVKLAPAVEESGDTELLHTLPAQRTTLNVEPVRRDVGLSTWHSMGGWVAEKQAQVREIVSQSLWASKGVHPARTRDARELFEVLLRVSREERKTANLVQHRREGELHIFHYTQKAQNTGAWTPELLIARGIIFRRNERTNAISCVATPFPKFFNLGEDGFELEELAHHVGSGESGYIEVTTKMDGSMGILFHDGTRWRVSTKGSFCSQQAAWADAWLKRWVNTTALTIGTTYLVEIIYRRNKIIISHSFDQLVLLSAFDVDGKELTRAELAAVVEATRPRRQVDVPALQVHSSVPAVKHSDFEPQLEAESAAEPEPEPEPERDAEAERDPELKRKKKHKKLLPSERRALKKLKQHVRFEAQAGSGRRLGPLAATTADAGSAASFATSFDLLPQVEDTDALDSCYGTVGAARPGMALPAVHTYDSLGAMLNDVRQQDGSFREGVVVRFVFPDGASHRIKIKSEDYLRRHRHMKHCTSQGFSPRRVIEAICRDPSGTQDSVTKMRNQVDEEHLAAFDAMMVRIGDGCDATLADIAAQRELASAEGIDQKRTVKVKLSRETAWADGTPISPAFQACWFAPFVPWDDCGGCTDVPTAQGAWRHLVGPSRKLLLRYVLPLVGSWA